MGVVRDIAALVAVGAGAAAAFSYWKSGTPDFGQTARVGQGSPVADVRRIVLQSLFFVAVASLATDFLLPVITRRTAGRRVRSSTNQGKNGATDGATQPVRPDDQRPSDSSSPSPSPSPSQPSSDSGSPSFPDLQGASTDRGSKEVEEEMHRVRESQQEQMNNASSAKDLQRKNKALEEAVRKQAQMQNLISEIAAGAPARSPEDDLRLLVAGRQHEYQQLRQQQDEEFRASLQADSLREEEIKQRENERVEEERRKVEEEKQRKAAEEAIKVMKKLKREALPPELAMGEPGRTLIAVRLLDSSVHRRSWHSSTRITEIYDWIDSLEHCTLRTEDCSIFTTFPRTELSRCDWGFKSLEEAGLCPQSMITLDRV